MPFKLHDLTDFYIERVTAHGIKIINIHVFIMAKLKNKTKIKSLKLRGPLGVSGALLSLRTLRIGRIGSVQNGQIAISTISAVHTSNKLSFLFFLFYILQFSIKYK